MKWLAQNILIFVAKIWGLWWIFVCISFRGYARSVVYNYVLQNNRTDWLRRLWERGPSGSINSANVEGWQITSSPPGHKLPELHGFIAQRHVTAAEFYAVVFLLWGWLDDDSDHDTTDLSYIQACIDGEHKDDIQSRLLRPWLKRIDMTSVKYGNAFDLGDVRAKYPFFNRIATLLWNTRNTAMNFQYLWTDY